MNDYDPNRWQHKEGNPGMDRLEREIHAQFAKLMNSVRTRKEHPSYGYTKARLREELNELVGMIKAWLYVTGKWEHTGAAILNFDIQYILMQEFEIDIKMAQFMVEAA